MNEDLSIAARKFIEDAAVWIRENPAEAAILSAAGGVLVGLTGVGRIYRGVKALRSMPLVSQLLVGVAAKGILAREFPRAWEPIH